MKLNEPYNRGRKPNERYNNDEGPEISVRTSLVSHGFIVGCLRDPAKKEGRYNCIDYSPN